MRRGLHRIKQTVALALDIAGDKRRAG
jgi:hypothetical protein